MGTVRRAVIAALVLAGVIAGTARGEPPPAEMNGKAASVFAEFREHGFRVAPSPPGPADRHEWAGWENRPGQGRHVGPEARCEEQTKATCSLHVVNNYTVSGQNSARPWCQRRAQECPTSAGCVHNPYWAMRGPQLAAGLMVWSHGYPNRQ